MSPTNPPRPFRVDWDPATVRDTAAASVAYFAVRESGRVAVAEQIAEYLLSDDPLRNGIAVSEGLFRLTVSPLQFSYEVYESARLVRVTAVRFFPV